MDPLGDFLKQAREKKGLALEDIALQTRIQEHHLLALEAEDFANLPAKVFAKGFVRSYAKALGLDEEEALQRFLQTSGAFYDQHEPDHPQPHAQVILEAPPRQGLNWTLIVGAIVVITVFVVWFGLPKKQEEQIVHSEREIPALVVPNEPAPPPVESQEIKQPLEPAVPTATPPAAPVPLPKLPPAPAPSTAPSLPNQPKLEPLVTTSAEPTTPAVSATTAEDSTNESPHILEIEATQLTWVVVKSDEEAPNEALLQPGQRNIWKADQQFLVTLGNAAGVILRLNGQPQGPFGKPGQVVRDIRIGP